MQELRQLISSPRDIMVFEAAARHQSFTNAAEELNTHQPAVSTAIKQLEQALGVLARKDWTWETGLGFFLLWSKMRELTVAAAQVRDWISGACKHDRI